MPQTNDITPATYKDRVTKLQAAMKEGHLDAVVLEPGAAMLYLTGVRWGKSERTFAVVVPRQGDPVWVLPGFEEGRARELIRAGGAIHVWQEDESPFRLIVDAIPHPAPGGPNVAIDEGLRFFIFDAMRKLSPAAHFESATKVLQQSGVNLTPPAGRGGRG